MNASVTVLISKFLSVWLKKTFWQCLSGLVSKDAKVRLNCSIDGNRLSHQQSFPTSCLSRVARVLPFNLRNTLLQLHRLRTRVRLDHGCIFHRLHRQRVQGVAVLPAGLLKLPLPWALLPSRQRRHTCVRRLGMHEIAVLRNRR